MSDADLITTIQQAVAAGLAPMQAKVEALEAKPVASSLVPEAVVPTPARMVPPPVAAPQRATTTTGRTAAIPNGTLTLHADGTFTLTGSIPKASDYRLTKNRKRKITSDYVTAPVTFPNIPGMQLNVFYHALWGPPPTGAAAVEN